MPIEKEDTIGLKYWSTKADENANSDPQINWKEGQMPSTVNNSARMMMARLKENELVTSQRFDNLENLIKNFIKQDSNILQLTIKKIYHLLQCLRSASRDSLPPQKNKVVRSFLTVVVSKFQDTLTVTGLDLRLFKRPLT